MLRGRRTGFVADFVDTTCALAVPLGFWLAIFVFHAGQGWHLHTTVVVILAAPPLVATALGLALGLRLRRAFAVGFVSFALSGALLLYTAVTIGRALAAASGAALICASVPE